MKFEPDGEAARWLEDLAGMPGEVDWDEGNRMKNLKHGVTSEEIESIFRQEAYLFAGKIVDPTHAEWRGLVLGQTDSGRRLALIFTRRENKLRPISCRPMRRNERRLYETSIESNFERRAGSRV
ncbi:MAG: BrnT family toxin [Nitrospirae bacterium]|nr:BrnT family toxin [Nitrospirota bacterium]